MAYPNVAGNAGLGQWNIFCENQNVMSGDQSLYENYTKIWLLLSAPYLKRAIDDQVILRMTSE